ncbi:MAG: AAA family ATPase [Phycisphaeraceae bacterium]|nr:AAA family ATPase [Phycisphaeraceae bacterium]
MRTIAIVNQKGGCGKTTTAISLSGALATLGQRVLLVDMDPQSHCAAGLAIPEGHIEQDVGDAMLASDPSKLDLNKLIWRIGRNLDLLPSRMKLAGLEASRGGLATLEDKDQRLAKVLRALSGYDLAIIDCSPSIGLLTYNALCAADEVLIPVEMSYFAQQGAARQVATLASLGQRLGRRARHWIVPTIHEPDAALPCELLDQLRTRFGSQVCQTVIHKDDKVKEAATFGRPVGEYAPQSQAARDYAELAQWLLAESEALQGAGGAATTGMSSLPGGVRAAGSPAPSLTEPMPTAQCTAPPAALPGSSPLGPANPWDAAVPSREQSVAQVAERARRAMELDTPPAPLATSARGPQADLPPTAFTPTPPTTSTQPSAPGAMELERLLLPKRGSEAFGAHPVRGGVWLVQPIGLGSSVAVAGEFNHWSAQSHRFCRYPNLGVHALRLELPAGRHAYRLVVDGVWTADPFNPVAVSNPFGEPNSIAEALPAAAAAMPGGQGASLAS